jgi:O-antigen/teichoic acid export membrane protein
MKASYQIIESSKIYTYQMMIRMALPLMLIPIVTSILTPAEYGSFVLIQVYVLFAIGVLNLGLLTSYERDFFEYKEGSRNFNSLYGSVFFFTLLTLSALFLVSIFYKSEVSQYIVASQDDVYVNLLILILAGESLLNVTQYYSIYLKNSGLAYEHSVYSIGRSILYFLYSLVFLLYFELGLISLGYSVFMTGVSIFVSVFVLQLKNIPFGFELKILFNTLKTSYLLTPRAFFGYLNTNLDKMMIGYFLNTSDVGIYSIGQKIAYTIFQFMTALDHVFIPQIYKALFSMERAKLKNLSNMLSIFFYIAIFFP